MLAADLAMYASKGAGGNGWRFADAVAKPPRGKYRPGEHEVEVAAGGR